MGSSDISNVFWVRILAGIGAVILIILAIINFIGFSLYGVIWGLLLLLVGMVVLISCFGSRKHGLPFTGIFILVMGIVAIIIGFFGGGLVGLIAGILIFVAGIIGLL